MEDGERQRPDRAAHERSFRKGRFEVQRTSLCALTQREQYTDRNALQPAEGEGEDASRALVDPLDVVEREKDRRFAGEFTDQTQGGDGESALVGSGTVGVDAQERDLQGSPLGGRKSLEHLRRNLREEIAEDAERELCFRSRGPRGQDAKSPTLRGRSAGPPQRGLSDAGFSLEGKRSEVGGSALEHAFDRGELLRAPDDLLARSHGNGHVTSLCSSRSTGRNRPPMSWRLEHVAGAPRAARLPGGQAVATSRPPAARHAERARPDR